jgi:hypothetical protein
VLAQELGDRGARITSRLPASVFRACVFAFAGELAMDADHPRRVPTSAQQRPIPLPMARVLLGVAVVGRVGSASAGRGVVGRGLSSGRKRLWIWPVREGPVRLLRGLPESV